MLLIDLPIEILDHVASALDLPLDLRNLGSTCSQLHRLVHPYHTQFRVIRTPIISPIWRKLAKDRSLAKNIRILEIQSAEPYGHSRDARLDTIVVPEMYTDWEVPQIYLANIVDIDDVDEDDVYKIARVRNAAKNAADLEAERDLVSALRGMSGLVSFRWVRTPPLINSDEEEDVWAALAKYCPALDSVDVRDREKPFDPSLEEDDLDDPAYQRPTCNPNFFLFQGLKKFSLMTEAFNVGNRAVPDFDRGMKMLIDKCPDLEVLKLHFVLYANPHSKFVSAAPLLSGSIWTSLRGFILSGVRLDSKQLSSFLSMHSAIEVLSLTACQIHHGPLFFPPGTLPNLKRLSTETVVAHSLLDSTTSIPRPLEHLTGSNLGDTFLEKFARSGSGLHLKHFSTVWTGNSSPALIYYISRLSRLAPNIEWLCLRSRPTFQIPRGIYPFFGQLRLHTLLGVRFLNSKCEPASANTEVIKALVTSCPKLRRLDWYNGHKLEQSLGVFIERNGPQVSWCLRNMIQRDIEGSVFTGWGERGCGSFQL